MDIHHESASQYDPETSSLISEHATFDERRSILYSRKLLPLLSFLLFLITNVIPIVISCGFYSRIHCFKLGTLEVSPLLQWIYIVITSMISPDDIPMNQIGNLGFAVTCAGTIGVLYSYMKKRFSVPEYAGNMTLLNVSYPIGTVSVICYFVYAAFEIQASSSQLQSN